MNPLKLREKLGNKFDVSISLNNIGLVYYKLSNYDKALAFYTQSLKLKREIQDRFDLDRLLLNIGLCYTHKKDFVNARKFVDEAFLLCKKDCSDFFLMSAFFSSGLIFFEQQNLIKAETDFLKSYLLSKKIDDIRYQFDNILALSKIYNQQNKVKLFEKYLKEAESLIAKDSNYNRELLGIYAELVNLYQQTDNLESISFYQGKYILLRDTIFNEEMATNLMESEAEFLERENQAKIESQNQIMALNNEVILRQRIVNIFFGVVVILVIILSIVLARSNKQKHLINKLLDQKVKERTHELIVNRDALQRAWLERDALINKASNDIRSSVATIKGLVFLGSKDIDHPKAPQYLHKLSTNFDHLADVLNKMVDSNSTVASMEKVNT